MGREEHKLGIRGSSTTPLIFEDCKVPVENVLGEIGKGHKVAFNVLNYGRFKLAAMCSGGAKAVIAEACRYANDRKQFGQAIASSPIFAEHGTNIAAVFDTDAAKIGAPIGNTVLLAYDRLPEGVPQDDETTLSHGDSRLGNMIIHPGEPRVAAVLAWELCTLGHPLAHVAYTCVPWNLPAERLNGYMGCDLAPLGYPSEAEFVADYCRHAGRADIPHWPFYVAFAMFRLAAISQGIAGRVRDGTAAGADAAERGARAPLLAARAWELLRPLTE